MIFLLFDLALIQEIFFLWKFQKRISPFLLISVPYIAIINLNNLIFSFIYDYDCVSDMALFKICLFLSLIFVIELFINLFWSRVKVKQNTSIFEKSNDSLVYILFFIGLLAYVLQFILKISTLGINNIKGTSGGILGHLSLLFFILAPLYCSKMIKHVKALIMAIPLVIGMIIAVLFGGKYVIMINVAYWLVSYILFNNLSFKKTAKLLGLLVLFALLVFFALYTVKPFITNSYGDRSLVILIPHTVEHFFNYLCAPVIGNNVAITGVGEDLASIPYTVPINIFKAVIRDSNYVSPIFSFLFQYSGSKSTNVAGFFGELHYCIGAWSFLYVAAMFFVIEIFWNYSIDSHKFFLTRCYFASIIAFLFFCNFFTVSGVVLPLVYVVFLEWLLPKVNTEVKFNPLRFLNRKNKGDGK